MPLLPPAIRVIFFDCGEHGFSGDAYDYVDNSLWYTFVGDGNTYHIESVPCNATNYIGVAQQDTGGHTHTIVYAGSDCSNLTEVVGCNEDLAGAVDFRAGLDLSPIRVRNTSCS